MDIINALGQGIHNIAGFFQPGTPSRQLPPGMVSPIPQNQVAVHQQPSAYQQAVDNVQNGIHQGISNVQQWGHLFGIGGPQVQQGPTQAMRPTATPAMRPPTTPTPYPGQVAWGNMMAQKNHGDPTYYQNMYKQAVSSPGFSGHYYGVTPTPTQAPTPSPYQQAQQQFNVNSVPDAPLPTGIDKALNYVSQFVPGGQDPRTYYPALADPKFMAGVIQADRQKPGLGNVLLMQAFHESTLGRAANNNNAFGALPGGEGSGRSAGFNSLADSLQYQLGPNMLGGGGNPNMNILGEAGPLTARRLAKLYQSYNPEGSYIKEMLSALQ